MASRKPYKHHKKGTGKFVQLHEWMLKTDAWRALKPGPRALFVELKRRYNGSNNGKISLSYREAAVLLNVDKNTVGGYFRALQKKGFILCTLQHCLGPSGVGETKHWLLDDEASMDCKPATKRFLKWVKENDFPYQ